MHTYAPQPYPEWLAPFLSYCHTKQYDKRVDFIRAGEPAESLYYLIEGSVAALIEDEDHRELTLAESPGRISAASLAAHGRWPGAC